MKEARFFICFLIFVLGCNNPQSKENISVIQKYNCFQSNKSQHGYTLMDDVYWNSFLIDSNCNTIWEMPAGLVELLPDGNLIGRKDSFLVKFDMHGNTIWKTKVSPEVHHSISVDSTGKIYVLTSEVHQFMKMDIRFDAINIYSSKGELLHRWSVYEHLSDFMHVISKSLWLRHLPTSFEKCKTIEQYVSQDPSSFIYPTEGDYNCNFEFTHFTSLEVLQRNSVTTKIPAFKEGNILLCFNPYSSYGIINTTTWEIEWVGYLPERTRLHSPTLTQQGTILVFQNNTDSAFWSNKEYAPALRTLLMKKIPQSTSVRNIVQRPWASVTEYDPTTNEKVWEYTASPKESMLVPHMGSAQRLPNGNTLVCITTSENGGSVFEVTKEKELVGKYSCQSIANRTKCNANLYRAKRIDFSRWEKIFNYSTNNEFILHKNAQE